MKVFILATCRKPELLPYTLLVFKTLRVGFPSADVEVHINGSIGGPPGWSAQVGDAAEFAGCKAEMIEETTHHEWIEKLIETQTDDFWILDTDVIFYASVEDWKFGTPLAGALIPEFNDPFLCATTRSRLHTSLMHIRPDEFNESMLAWEDKHPRTKYNPMAELVYPLCLPLNGRSCFYDTMAMAYHAIGGTPFTTQQKDCYFHFHFGSFSDLVLPSMKDGIAEAREMILNDPSLGIGLWRKQEEWFAARQFVENGTDVIAPIKPEDAVDARKWNVELCKGNQAAMAFCDQWYRYCHGIDDLIDTLRDGRPRMSKDQMVSLFFNAAVLYGSEFYVQNRDALMPIVLLVTNTYRDSIAWEHAPESHLRQMADVFRTCGNEMYVMVALLCGGEEHMRTMSMKIKERDWLGQHDKHGNPV